jgi:hypothetical protein
MEVRADVLLSQDQFTAKRQNLKEAIPKLDRVYEELCEERSRIYLQKSGRFMIA